MLDKIKLMTVRGTNFEKLAKGDDNGYSTTQVEGVDEIVGASKG